MKILIFLAALASVSCGTCTAAQIQDGKQIASCLVSGVVKTGLDLLMNEMDRAIAGSPTDAAAITQIETIAAKDGTPTALCALDKLVALWGDAPSPTPGTQSREEPRRRRARMARERIVSLG